jgi:hypothetical protein
MGDRWKMSIDEGAYDIERNAREDVCVDEEVDKDLERGFVEYTESQEHVKEDPSLCQRHRSDAWVDGTD